MKKLNAFLQRVEVFFGALCLGIILAIMLINVVFRYFLSLPIFWAEEANNFLFVWMGYLGFAYVMGDDNHIKVTLLESRLPAPVRRVARVLGHIVIMATCFGMAWPTFKVLPQLHKSAAMGLPEKYVGGIGHLCYKAMVDKGYDKEFSAAVTMASSTIGPIIPPSIPMVIYAMVANVSIGKLFFGGIIPGLMMGAMLMLYVYIVSVRRNYPVEKAPPFPVLARLIVSSFIRSFLPLMTPVILLGGIYLGFVTVTEASAIAVLYSICLGMFLYRTLNVGDFWDSLKQVFATCGAILMVIPAAKAFGFVLNAMIGNLTPPVGVVLMTVCGMEKLSIEAMSRAMVPFILLLFALLAVIILFPQTVLFLPNLLFNR